MKKLTLLLFGVVFLSSCTGISIKPITTEQNTQMHMKESNLDGYILYAPKVFLVVKNTQTTCDISTFQMPNYDKPFALNIESRLGKINTNIEIKDGWMLVSIKADIDNTSVLSSIKDVIKDVIKTDRQIFIAEKEKNDPKNKPICGLESGIYSLEKIKGNDWELKQVTIEGQDPPNKPNAEES